MPKVHLLLSAATASCSYSSNVLVLSLHHLSSRSAVSSGAPTFGACSSAPQILQLLLSHSISGVLCLLLTMQHSSQHLLAAWRGTISHLQHMNPVKDRILTLGAYAAMLRCEASLQPAQRLTALQEPLHAASKPCEAHDPHSPVQIRPRHVTLAAAMPPNVASLARHPR
jgi:hypothetical protein